MSVHNYSVEDATLEDALLMAHRMRDVDKQEIWASNRSRPLEALVNSVRYSESARTGRADGEIVCMFGVSRQNLMGTRGCIWLLGTDLLKRHGIRFLRENNKEIVDLSENFTIIENYCDARNTATLRWLGWLGFTIEKAKPYGIYNLPFHHFHKEVA
tara:strand:+ start:32969 stop:33439 length:471 start_codon:yes stop_codon:yes gene_type:complete